jgi:hypothetical protein
MHRSFESPASFSPSLRRTNAVTAFVAVATIGGLPFAHSLVGTGTHQSPFGLQAAVAAAPARQASDADRVAAREAMARSEWRKAIDLWNTVLAAAPGDDEAVRNLQLAQAALDQGSAIQSVEQDINIRRERAKVMFGGLRKASSLAFMIACLAIDSGPSTRLKFDCSSARRRSISIRCDEIGWL